MPYSNEYLVPPHCRAKISNSNARIRFCWKISAFRTETSVVDIRLLSCRVPRAIFHRIDDHEWVRSFFRIRRVCSSTWIFRYFSATFLTKFGEISKCLPVYVFSRFNFFSDRCHHIVKSLEHQSNWHVSDVISDRCQKIWRHLRIGVHRIDTILDLVFVLFLW